MTQKIIFSRNFKFYKKWGLDQKILKVYISFFIKYKILKKKIFFSLYKIKLFMHKQRIELNPYIY